MEINFDITIITKDENAVKKIRNTLSKCNIPREMVMFLSSFPRSFATSLKKYDYIEYNGGISLSNAYKDDLARMSQVTLFRNVS